MDDYLSEKEQWEWLKTQLKVNGPWIVAGVAAGGLLLSGWHWWQGHTDELATQASAQSLQIAEAFGRRDRARALAMIDTLKREQPKSPYLDEVNLVAARAFAQKIVDGAHLECPYSKATHGNINVVTTVITEPVAHGA